MKTIEELAFDVLESDFIPDAIGAELLISYSKRLIAAWQEQQEPAGYFYMDDRGFWNQAGDQKGFSSMTPLYLAPPPAQGEDK